MLEELWKGIQHCCTRELMAEKFDWFQTLRNNMQQGLQTDNM